MKRSRAHFLRSPGSFGISRKLSASSKKELEFTQQLPGVFPESDIIPRRLGELSLTMLEKGEMSRSLANGRLHENIKSYSYSRGVIGGLLLNECQGAAIDSPVLQPDYMGTHRSYTRLVLKLDDPDRTLAHDVESIRSSIDPNEHWKEFVPHITIATISTACATNEVLEWAQERAPESITLNPPKIV